MALALPGLGAGAGDAAAAASSAAGGLGPAAAVAGAGMVGYGLGSLIYPHLAEPLSNAIDEMCLDSAEEECKEEWEQAYKICEREIAQGVNRGISGGYKDLYNCATGLVSQRCGGNRIN